MPVLKTPDYAPPFPFTNGHVQTIYATLCRKTPLTAPVRERIDTDDGDFLDLDRHFTSAAPATGLAVLSHGLEGDSRRKNMLGMADALTSQGWDVICFNFRGCSGVPNRLLRLYHSGITDDLHRVLQHGLAQGTYTRAALIGFSMGGNQTLKYLGEAPELVPKEVKAAVAISVPCQLADSALHMAGWTNRIYMHYFMRELKEKINIKAAMFPGRIDTDGLEKMKSFYPFDNKYTGPIHGYKDADDYYLRCSCKQFLHRITVPTLLLQAEDDPFLPQSCYPYEEAQHSTRLFLEIPRYGGHVGFVGKPFRRRYWSEERTVRFLNDILVEEISAEEQTRILHEKSKYMLSRSNFTR